MARPRVAIASLTGDDHVLGGEDHHYLTRVLRVAVGDEVTLFDGAGGEADARIVAASPTEVHLRVLARRARAGAVGARITLLVGLLKHDKMDWVVQKATELGVAGIVPVACARAVVRLEGERAASRAQRWQKIASEATRQCGGARVPVVAEVQPLAAALATPADLRVLFWEDPRAGGARAALRGGTVVSSVAALIGPEGGFTEAEAAAAQAAGYVPVGLGPRILRAETAALAALTVLAWELGDLAT